MTAKIFRRRKNFWGPKIPPGGENFWGEISWVRNFWGKSSGSIKFLAKMPPKGKNSGGKISRREKNQNQLKLGLNPNFSQLGLGP